MRELKFKIWNGKTMGQSQPIGSMKLHYRRSSDVILQYTGLKDKNDREIYEGDIIEIQWVEDETWDRGTVVYCDAGFRFVMEGEHFSHDPHHLHKKCTDIWDDQEVLIIEVIGNIYENPELLND